MRRRNTSEIQVAYTSSDKVKYDLLIPKYPRIEHNDTYNTIEANKGNINDDSYDRDNYYIIPYKVPPMTFNGISYALSWGNLGKTIPTVSIARDVNYDKDIWTVDDKSSINLWVDGFYSFSAVVLDAYQAFENILNASLYECTGDDPDKTCVRNTGYPDYNNRPSEYQCGPLDKVDTGYMGIADAFSYAWSDAWDMNLSYSLVKYGNATRKDDSSSSSSSSEPPAGGALLCRVVDPPSSAGGTATVVVISVNSEGGIKEGRSLVVNVPAI